MKTQLPGRVKQAINNAAHTPWGSMTLYHIWWLLVSVLALPFSLVYLVLSFVVESLMLMTGFRSGAGLVSRAQRGAVPLKARGSLVVAVTGCDTGFGHDAAIALASCGGSISLRMLTLTGTRLKEPPPGSDGRKLFVYFNKESVDVNSLRRLGERHGRVINCHLAGGNGKKAHAGYGYIEFASKGEAVAAQGALDGAKWDEFEVKKLQVAAQDAAEAGRRVFVMGESMGAGIALDAARGTLEGAKC